MAIAWRRTLRRQGFAHPARSPAAAREKSPVEFSVCAFTVEQGKFLRPIEPLGEYLKQRGVDWTYHTDRPSLRLLKEQPDHGCDLCSRYRRRAVYEIVRGLGANVIAFGHTADDFCESFLRNAMFTGRVSALPPITYSRDKEFRLIRPLVFVTEDITIDSRNFRRADYSVRLLPTNRNGATSRFAVSSAKSKRIIRTEGKRCSPRWGTWNPAVTGPALSRSGSHKSDAIEPLLPILTE